MTVLAALAFAAAAIRFTVEAHRKEDSLIHSLAWILAAMFCWSFVIAFLGGRVHL